MNNVIQTIDWMQILSVIWTVVLLPVITYVGTQAGNYAKAIDRIARCQFREYPQRKSE